MTEREPPADEHRHPAGQFGLESEDTLTLEQASQLLGVAEATIVCWERRYHLTSLNRGHDGARYSLNAIRVLRRLRDYIATGSGTFEAASVLSAPVGSSPDRLVSALLAATRQLQPGDIPRVLDTAQRLLGLERTLDEVLWPALRAIGQDWAEGTVSIAQEHAASVATQAWLAAVGDRADARRRSQPIVLACGPRDQHTLALESLGALLRGRGWNCLLLGARTPAPALRQTITEVAPAAVVVVSHLDSTRRSAVEAVHSVHTQPVPLFVAGNAFRTTSDRAGVPATYLGESVAGAADLISTSVASGTLGR